MATRRVQGPVFKAGAWSDPSPALPVLTTTHGFGSLVGPGQNPVAGKQDRELQRFHGKKGPSGTQESLSSSHGHGKLGKYGDA